MNPTEIGLAVADAVVVTLNAGEEADAFASYWADGFTAQRIWDTSITLEGNTTLRVDVLQAEPVVVHRETRATWKCLVPIFIAVRKQCSESSVAACDALTKLTGEIWDYMASNNGSPRSLEGYADAVLDFPDNAAEAPVVVLPDYLHSHNQFTGIVRLDYRVDGA